ncbi:response regulator transcription factor [Paenibacillus sp. FJAT-27812]|uniref:response regulator transcription factor n=1 Tax=Paenibacillus sp. FJAT-27812 TaxID=1684143 RepID=UPI0006A7EF61|nr:response regulator [Paenibacillus sp. FJAT-27812]
MKICVVDDESEVRVSIIQKLTALFPHVQVFNTEFGYEALKRIELIQPDLVFLDIRMPELDGLQILQRLHERYPAIHVVIISGYDDFEYARRALTHGATDFLLKPADRGELSDIVLKVKSMMEQRFLKELDQLLNIAPISHVSLDKVRTANVSLWFDEREWKQVELLDPAAQKSSSIPLHDILLTVLLDVDLEAIVFRAPVEHTDRGFREKKDFLPVLHSQIRMKKELLFFQKNDPDLPVSRSDRKDHAKQAVRHRQAIIHLARTGEVGELEAAMAKWSTCLKKISYEDLRKECAHLMAVLDEGLGKSDLIMVDEDTLYYWDEWVGRHHTWNDLIGRVHHMVLNGVKELKNLDQQEREAPQANGWFKQALQVIASSSDKNLSLEVVSEAVNVHPVTLSRMFKQQMGITFVRFLTRRRMQHASELLLNTSKKGNEISEDIGYADYAYFRSLFKKEFGCSPSEFRKKNGIMTAADETE